MHVHGCGIRKGHVHAVGDRSRGVAGGETGAVHKHGDRAFVFQVGIQVAVPAAGGDQREGDEGDEISGVERHAVQRAAAAEHLAAGGERVSDSLGSLSVSVEKTSPAGRVPVGAVVMGNKGRQVQWTPDCMSLTPGG